MIKLTEAKPGTSVFLKEVQGGKNLKAKLIAQGFVQGAPFDVLECLSWGGPVLVEINGVKIAIGRRMAEKIFVEPLAKTKEMPG